MKKEYRVCNRTSDMVGIYDFYQNELGLEVYKHWDRSEEDKGVIFVLGDILIEYLLDGDPQKAGWIYLCIEEENIEEFHAECRARNKTELIHTAWKHTKFSVFDPEGLEIKFFKDNGKVK